MKYKNIAWVLAPKYKSPFNDGKTYFCPALVNQQGNERNYIVITCSPSYNGVWVYTTNPSQYKAWNNNGKTCIYVPVDDCEFYKTLGQIENKETIAKIKDMQDKWYKGQIKNKPAYKKDRPDWFL